MTASCTPTAASLHVRCPAGGSASSSTGGATLHGRARRQARTAVHEHALARVWQRRQSKLRRWFMRPSGASGQRCTRGAPRPRTATCSPLTCPRVRRGAQVWPSSVLFVVARGVGCSECLQITWRNPSSASCYCRQRRHLQVASLEVLFRGDLQSGQEC
jgi:hypothetical protein